MAGDREVEMETPEDDREERETSFHRSKTILSKIASEFIPESRPFTSVALSYEVDIVRDKYRDWRYEEQNVDDTTQIRHDEIRKFAV